MFTHELGLFSDGCTLISSIFSNYLILEVKILLNVHKRR